jgi:undecaprenyl-diphosphatase
MVTFLEIVVLAIIQGITEWLPLSSSGHLVIFQELLGIQVPVSFDIGLHLGSILALALYFRTKIVARIRKGNPLHSNVKEKQLILHLVLSGISTVIIVLVLNEFIRVVFTDLRAVGLGLFVTGLLLAVSRCTTGRNGLNVKKAILIGIAQGVAAIPGISRSGTTLSVGCLLGTQRETVFTYSLLLSVPTIIGAAIYESGSYSSNFLEAELLLFGIGVTAAVGYLSISLLKKIYDRKSGLVIFIPYCVILGLVLFVFG